MYSMLNFRCISIYLLYQVICCLLSLLISSIVTYSLAANDYTIYVTGNIIRGVATKKNKTVNLYASHKFKCCGYITRKALSRLFQVPYSETAATSEISANLSTRIDHHKRS